ncbi:MAG TPA: PEGA domain-containing protein, partial [Terriglobales bacterium]|nr:PEGA domain-containing protein [Terriglobales bacterium]
TAKIMDFGIAKSGGGLTSTGQVLGTPNYMSPEQVRGKPLDGRSDLFSFGVILYETVTGTKPFGSDNVTTIIYKIINEQPRAAHLVNPKVPHTLSAIITKALAKSPEQRYQRGADLVRDLANHANAGINEGTVKVAAQQTASPPAAVAQPKPAEALPQPTAATATAKPASSGLTTTVGSRVVPLWSIIAAAVVALALLAGGILAYVRHSQAQQRAELERLLNQQSPAQTQPQQPASPEPTPGAASNESSSPASTPQATKAQPSAPEAATGELVVNSIPDGAQVQIDGRSDPTWHTPFTAPSLAAGSHTVAFTLAGYVRTSRTVQVSAGRQAVLATKLTPQTAMTEINSDPAGAAISVDGSITGKLTPAQLALAPGDHSIVLKKEGFSDLTTSVHLTEGQAYHYSETLEPVARPSGMNKFKKLFGGSDKVAVKIQTNPAGAEISIDGTDQSKSTPAKLSLEPGTHTLALQRKGYKPLSKAITVEKNTPLQIDESLEKQ